MDKSQLILELCDRYRKAVVTEQGINIGPDSERFRLRSNRIHFHELNYAEIQACCVGLSNTLLYKGLNAIIHDDHRFFWSWIGELFLIEDTGYFSPDEMKIKQLFHSVIRLCLAGSKAPVRSREELHRRRMADVLVDHNTRDVVQNKHLIVAYLSFPFLEAMLKKHCQEYIDYSGRVRRPFKVRNREYPTDTQCSSLRDLLLLCSTVVAGEDLQHHLELIVKCFGEISRRDPYDLIYDWRNSLLHGSTSYATIGGMVLNVAILIALDGIREQYETIRAAAAGRVAAMLRSASLRAQRGNYYPPYL